MAISVVTSSPLPEEGGSVPPPALPGSVTGSKARPKKAPAGGWRSSTGLTLAIVRDISDLAHHADFNVMITIMPIGGTDADRKRCISREVAHLGQAFKRRGQLHVGVTIYEKSSTADLHGHHVCHVDKANLELLKKFDGKVVHVRLFQAGGRADVIAYCTKQRLPQAPGFERTIGHRREKGMSIRGPRWSTTLAARGVLLDLDDERNHGDGNQPKKTTNWMRQA